MKRALLIIAIILLLSPIGAKTASAAEYPTAPLGSADSMMQFVEWLVELGRELIGIFTSAMDLLGLSNETHVGDMLTTLDDGMSLVNTTKSQD
ncbi:MAG: Uncharacterized protein XE11_1617 [Methanomicrobiales archaeon 53_19]|jgi:hypothetical protein|uniref:hypothetical protein n=1 Tax=Methanocalculus sp. TaxID=2004547 RepID=UPI000749D29B|nr:hypothetical protein [Methanocalculus sp.]KUK71021.1 MAG: Uncharacterized protein XD88_0287 [Methanocalculus sp. 52_23]KUL02805.1 MAG: Uncharacterized protein XE11_1617 [Methanomicrobiales archaeon 53_19]HIJ06167.1 hypothetical protein [Methanocalculus sp.]